MSAPDAHPTAFGDVAPPSPGDVLAPAAGFVRLPRAVLRAPGLSDRAKLLYALLLDYARQDGCCWPGLARLRADLGGGHNQLARAVRELEAGGLITRRRRGFGKTTVYAFRPLPGPAGPLPSTPPSPTRPAETRRTEILIGDFSSRLEKLGPVTPGQRTDLQPSLASEGSEARGWRTRCANLPNDVPKDDASTSRLLAEPTAPRAGGPVRPGPAAQTAPQRGAQDLEAEDHDAEDQHPPAAAGSPSGGTRRQREGVVARLIEQGVTPGVARQLVARGAPEVLERQLACHPHRIATGGLARNPAGALVRAIREDWAPPAAWTATQQRVAAQARQAEEDARHREAEAARIREWELRPPEERIAGRLQFWVLGQRAKRREPTAAEIAARQAALLAELADHAPSGTTAAASSGSSGE